MRNTTGKIVYDYLNKRKWLYLLVGTLCLVAGILIDLLSKEGNEVKEEHGIGTFIISHFLLILGEALIVFFLINIVLEQETKEKFLKETTSLMKEQEQQIIDSFKDHSTDLLRKTNDLFADINNDIFKIILQERTSPEIAKEINENDFFKGNYLKANTEMNMEFYHDPIANTFKLIHTEEGLIKNISKGNLPYVMYLSCTSTISKTYRFHKAGYAKNQSTNEYTDLKEEDFDITIMENVKSGKLFTLKNPIDLGPEDCLKIYRVYEINFVENPDGIDDNFFTVCSIMPFNLKIKVPPGYDFAISPTFPQEKLSKPFVNFKDIIEYKIPFLLPGQGFTWSLIKKELSS